MNISIEGKTIELTEAIKNRAVKEIEKKLTKYEKMITKVTMVLDYVKDRHGTQPDADVKIVVSVSGPDIVVNKQHDDLYEAIDYCVDIAADQLQERKEM